MEPEAIIFLLSMIFIGALFGSVLNPRKCLHEFEDWEDHLDNESTLMY